MTEIIPRGKILMIDKGEYSDYTVCGIFRVKEDFNWKDAVIRFEKEPPHNNINTYAFISHLVVEGVIEEVEYSSLYLGYDGEVEEISYYG